MESEKKYNINLAEGVEELIIREGEAIPQINKKALNILGDIFTPFLFANHRKPDPQSCHVINDVDNKKITFIINESNCLKGEIVGEMRLSKYFKELQIGKQFNDLTAFGNHIKKFKRFFPTPESNMILVSAFKKFKIKINQELEKDSDDRGKFISKIDQSVDNDLPTEFTLKMPIIHGLSPKSFLVEIFFSVRDKGLTVWMESSESEDIVDSEVSRVLKAEKEKFEKEGLLVIEK